MPVDGITRADAEALFAEQIGAEVVGATMKSSVALATLPTMPLGSASYRVPVLESLPTASFLTADQAVKPQTEVSWDKKFLTVEEIACIVPISETVIADTNIDVVGRVSALVAQEFGRVIDAAVFFGTGAPASWPTGGLFAASANNDWTAAIPDDVNTMFSAVEDLGYDVDRTYLDRRMKGQLRGMKDGNGTPLFVPTDGAANVGSLYGVPSQFPLGWDRTKASMLALNTSCILLGIRQDITTKFLDQASLTGFGNLAERDSVAVRFVMRLGFALADPITLDNPDRTLPIASIDPIGT